LLPGATLRLIPSGIQTCACPGYVNPSGMIPTTVRVCPFTGIADPTTDGSPPKRRVHNPWLITITGLAFGWSSSAVNQRPRSAGTCMASKNCADTLQPATCSGSPRSVIVALPGVIAPRTSSELLRSRSATYFAADTDADDTAG
jgi:hypothetical protein